MSELINHLIDKVFADSGKCPASGCVKKDENGKLRVISNKTGKLWKAHYDTKELAEEGLAAYQFNKNMSDADMPEDVIDGEEEPSEISLEELKDSIIKALDSDDIDYVKEVLIQCYQLSEHELNEEELSNEGREFADTNKASDLATQLYKLHKRIQAADDAGVKLELEAEYKKLREHLPAAQAERLAQQGEMTKEEAVKQIDDLNSF